MEVIITSDYKQVCSESAAVIQEAWKRKNDLVFGLATGKTPLGLYEKLIGLYREGEMDFSSVVAFNLDEYLGLGETHISAWLSQSGPEDFTAAVEKSKIYGIQAGSTLQRRKRS